jgi:FAD dependent oxidoreductase TIGR03364
MARVVIVGGGIVGTTQAFLALKAGHEVEQLEREPAARGASVRNFGLIWVSGRRRGAELSFARRSRELWEGIAAEVPEVGFRANGSLTIVQDEAGLRVLQEVMARGDAGQRGFSLLDCDEARIANPAVRGEIMAALYCALDAAVEPARATAAIRQAMQRDPRYRWLPGRHVVEVDAGGVRDHTGERHHADVVLVCPGAAHRGFEGWSPEEAPLRRVRLQMLETEPFPGVIPTSIADGDSLRYYPAFQVPALADLPAPPQIVADRHIQLLLQQRLDGRLTIGDTHEYDEPFDVAVAEEPYRHLQQRVESILGMPMPPVHRRWAGVYSQALDDRLYYADQVADSAWIVTGVGGRGMTLAPAIAEQVLATAGLVRQEMRTTSSTGA